MTKLKPDGSTSSEAPPSRTVNAAYVPDYHLTPQFRAETAKANMAAGFASLSETPASETPKFWLLAQDAVKAADALIKELSKNG